MGAFWEGLSSQSHATGAEPATPPKATANHHHGSPARNSTNAPLIATSIAVPKSGCSITSAVGTAMITPVASTAPTRGGNSCRSRYQAAIIGRLSRSEEHTSELQSLMRISYAVFCLKKKNTQQKAPQQK